MHCFEIYFCFFLGIFTLSLSTPSYGTPVENELIFSKGEPDDDNVICFGERFSSIEEHPYVVGIYVYDEYFCSGAIVSPSWVVTGGSCVAWYNADNLTVVAGSDYLNNVSGHSYPVQQTLTHPNYSPFEIDYQFACVQIRGTFDWSSKIKPISLPSTPIPANTILTVVGWTEGFEKQKLTSGRPDSNSFLQEGLMAWLSADVCNATFFASGVTWTETMACAYNNTRTIFCGTGWYDPFVKDGVLYGQFIQELYPKGYKHKRANLYSLVSNISAVTPWITDIIGA